MTTMTSMLEVAHDELVTTIELRREERRNALNAELVQALKEAVAAAAESARVIVLTGQGPIFCAGADLDEVYSETFTAGLLEMLHTIDSVPVPVIAAINGGALGAGVQLALAADLRVLEPSAYVAIPAAKLGITVDRWTVQRLASLIGSGPARTMLFGAAPITAEAALSYGFANKLGTVSEAQEWAREIAGLAPLTLRHLKLAFNDDGTRAPVPAEQQAAMLAAWTSADAQEGRLARTERRPPSFTGR